MELLRCSELASWDLTGKRVVIGFADTGIDYRNPVFRKPDGSTRILAIWDQTIQSGTPPEGFVYGSEYTRQQINEALKREDPYSLVPTRDEDGHEPGWHLQQQEVH